MKKDKGVINIGCVIDKEGKRRGNIMEHASKCERNALNLEWHAPPFGLL